jgi:hypothetical protein
MTDEKLGKLTSLVPEIYYDLIARVAVGVVLIVVLAACLATPVSLLVPLERLSWPTATILFALLLIISNSVGLIITPFGELFYDFFAPSIWSRVLKEHPDLAGKARHFGLEFPADAKRDHILQLSSQMGDLLRNLDGQAGQVTTKMRAEVAFCNNLAASLLVSVIVLIPFGIRNGHLKDQVWCLSTMFAASAFVVAAGRSVQLQFFRRRVSMLLVCKHTSG